MIEDKGKGRADEVVVVDFANPDPLTKGKIKQPETKEEWHDFITKYTLGEYNEANFTETNPSSPPEPFRNPSNETGITTSTESATVTAHVFASSSATPSRRRSSIPAIPIRQNSNTSDSSENEPQDTHGDTSFAGPSNQDPNIPNIESDGSTEASFSKEPKRQVKKDEENHKDYKLQESMTTENMRQLGLEQQEDRVKDRDNGAKKDGEKKMKIKRRQRDHAELASAGKSMSVDSSEDEDPSRVKPRRRAPRRPRSRGSWSLRSKSPKGSLIHRGTGPSLDRSLLESGTNDSSISAGDIAYDQGKERERLRQFFEENGYMPAPRQPPEAARRRLRVIRRLGLEDIDPFHRETLDRFTRLATTVFKTRSALISIITKDKQIFLSEIGMGRKWTDLDVSFCCHSIMSPGSGEQCLVVQDASKDWRFKKNPLVNEGSGPVQFYAGAPLRVGSGNKSTIIGSLCVLDDKPRGFSDDDKKLLADLADCVVSELELIYSQQASIESAKLHTISVDFLRRSLKHRPNEIAGSSGKAGTGTRTSTAGTADKPEKSTTASSTSSLNGKRISGADKDQDQNDIDIYDEACREVRNALDAYAVAVVDLSQFHLFYPTYQNSSVGGGSSTRGGSTSAKSKSQNTGTAVQSSFGGKTGSTASSTARGLGDDDEQDAYSKPFNVKRALPTYAVTDPLAPSRTPQVLFIPSRRKSDPNARYSFPRDSNGDGDGGNTDNLAVLGYSCSEDGFAFNFTSSPAARKIISDFIASNVKTRKVWYTRDDNEGIAQSINHLMPPGTETSMAMPVFGFDGQVAFAIVACWTDPLYTYPAGAMQFVETIAGSLLASVMKERLHRAERAQLNFAAAASHELRTPLHQINAAASLLRMALHGVLENDSDSIIKISKEDRIEASAQLEIIEANGLSLGGILENIIDTLDIGKMVSKVEQITTNPDGSTIPPDLLRPRSTAVISNLSDTLEQVVREAMNIEAKTRRINNGTGLEDIEVILEVLPRNRGSWKISSDPGPLSRALSKIVHNAVKFTTKGHVHITVQDVSRDVTLPGGYDNSIKLSTVSIDIKDTGRGMTSDFMEREVLRPFAKEDAFTPGSGLGLGLAQRMIELLGGKLAIASTLGKGTLVHVEIPIHLLNEDNDSDQDVMVSGKESIFETNQEEVNETIRQDGIHLIGWNESKNSTIRRVGKSLARQLKLHFCRLVTEINYASLIVLPENSISEIKLSELCKKARPSVQIVVIGKDHSFGALAPTSGPITSKEYKNDEIENNNLRREGESNSYSYGHHHHSIDNNDNPKISPERESAIRYLKTIPTIYLTRPLRPSLIKRIMQPADSPPPLREIYKSDVVGGEEAKEEVELQNAIIVEGGGSDSASIGKVEIEDEDNTPEAPKSGNTIKDPIDKKGQDLMSSDTDDSNDLDVLTLPKSRKGSLIEFGFDSTLGSISTSNLNSGLGSGLGSGTISPKSSSNTLKRVISPKSLNTSHSHSHPHHHHRHHHHERGDTSESTTASDQITSTTTDSGKDGRTTESSVTSEGGYQASINSDSSLNSDSSELPLPLPRFREVRSGSDHTIRGMGNQSSDGDPLKVLVVEDNAVNRKILTTMLKRTSCHFAEAADGVEAVDRFNSFHPDLVLLDITMPRKDGFAAAAEMRHLEATLPADSAVPLEEVMKALAVSTEPPIQTEPEPETPPPLTSTSQISTPKPESTSTINNTPPPISTPSSSSETPLSPLSPTSSCSGLNEGGSSSRPKRSRAKIIAVTAMSAEHQRRKGLIESGIDMWMVKPIAMRELRGIVERMKEEKLGWSSNTSNTSNSVNGGGSEVVNVGSSLGARSENGSSVSRR